MSEPQETRKPNRFRITSIVIAIVGIMTILVFLPMLTSAQEAGVVTNRGTNTDIVCTPAYSNPVLMVNTCEETIIYNETMGWLDMWFASGITYGASGHNYLWYAHTTNANFTTHTTPVRIMQLIRFPYIVHYNEYFYCFAHNNSSPVGNLYLWRSPDRLNWTIQNGGAPVLYHSTDTASLRYWMANPAVLLINNMWYMWIDCAPTYTAETWNLSGIAYSYSAFSSSLNFTANMTTTQVLPLGAGAPFAQYVPDRNAVMIMYIQLTSDTLGQIMSSTIPFSANKALASSYTTQTGFVIGLVAQITSDFAWTETPTGLVFQIYHNQPVSCDIYQANISLTALQFYDELTGYVAPTIIDSQVSGVVNLVFLMFAVGIVVGVVAEGTNSLRKMQMRTTEQMVKSLLNMVVYIIIGMASLGVLYSIVV